MAVTFWVNEAEHNNMACFRPFYSVKTIGEYRVFIPSVVQNYTGTDVQPKKDIVDILNYVDFINSLNILPVTLESPQVQVVNVHRDYEEIDTLGHIASFSVKKTTCLTAVQVVLNLLRYAFEERKHAAISRTIMLITKMDGYDKKFAPCVMALAHCAKSSCTGCGHCMGTLHGYYRHSPEGIREIILDKDKTDSTTYCKAFKPLRNNKIELSVKNWADVMRLITPKEDA